MTQPLPSAKPEEVGLSQAALDRLSTALNDRITSGHIPGAVALVARTDLVAQVPEKVAAAAVADGRVVMLDWPRADAAYHMAMIWHARHRSDQGLAWLRDRIGAVVG